MKDYQKVLEDLEEEINRIINIGEGKIKDNDKERVHALSINDRCFLLGKNFEIANMCANLRVALDSSNND
jgi:predicted Zn-dependent peptidase